MEPHAAVTPPSRLSEARLLRNRPPPCLARPFDGGSSDDDNGNVHAVTLPPKTRSPVSPSPSPLHLAIHASSHAPLQELLLLPQSPAAKRRQKFLVQGENVDPAVANPCRKCKKSVSTTVTATSNMGLTGCASPRNLRRARRRLDKEINREEKPTDVFEDDFVRVRRRRQSKSANSRREKPSLALPAPLPPSPSERTSDDNQPSDLDGLKEVILELIMWKNVAKSSLWFGLGSVFCISSSFSRDLNFCAVSAVSNVGLFILAVAFFGDSISQRRHERVHKRFSLTEEDILRVVRLVLPAFNAAIVMAQEVFSGEPSMTLKVAPVLLFAAKYGYYITLRRLLVAGFFLSFTAPKLYTSYSSHILTHAESRCRSVLEAWRACRHKKTLAISGATALWNLLSVKTRIFAAFICLVVLRYYCQKRSVVQQRQGGAGAVAVAVGGGVYEENEREQQEPRIRTLLAASAPAEDEMETNEM